MSTAASRLRFDPALLPARLIVVMGVAGCGKSTIGGELAGRIGATYLEGDDFHPEENIAKMSRGEPLTDNDRWSWLERFARRMTREAGATVGGCSALKRSYRERIAATAGEPVLFVYLKGDRELIGRRMAERSGHFMPQSLVDSQFAALEAPGADENAIAVLIDRPTNEIVAEIAARIEGNLA